MRYATRYVAFIDILGISELLSNAQHSERYARAIFRIVSVLAARKGDIFFILEHIKNGREVEIQFDRPEGKGGRLSFISDSVVLSYPELVLDNPFAPNSRVLSLLTCLEDTFWLQKGLLALGVRTRGGIAKGRLFHARDRVLGEGLVKAYRLEKEVARFPRVVIDPEIIQVLLSSAVPEGIALFRNRIAHMIRLDADGHYFVDYLGFDPIGGYFGLQRQLPFIVAETKNDLDATTDGRICEKLHWLMKYALSAAEDITNDQSALQRNRGTLFHESYPRTLENVSTWVAEFLASESTTASEGPE